MFSERFKLFGGSIGGFAGIDVRFTRFEVCQIDLRFCVFGLVVGGQVCYSVVVGVAHANR